ncbi:MAG: glycosyltransferase family 2 protein [Candidatus Aadella gelida]|nr:glycosyltransferase family 2 protein [Candidatus Aadella gelida]
MTTDVNEYCAIVPAYNEERTIGKVVSAVRSNKIDVIVVDDGSDDNTGKYAEEKGALLLKNGKNEGKGNALRKGFNFVQEKGYKYFFTIDADAQHNPKDIPKFIEKMRVTGSDIVAGNRLANPRNMPDDRLAINRWSSSLISKISGQYVPDPLCGFRLIRAGVLKKIDLEGKRFEIVPEILIKASKMGFVIDEVEIVSIYADETSYIRPLRDGYMFFSFLIKEWIKN